MSEKEYKGKLRRLFKEIRYLYRSPMGVTINALSGLLGVSYRTVYRDIEILHDVGFTVVEVSRGMFRIEGSTVQDFLRHFEEANDYQTEMPINKETLRFAGWNMHSASEPEELKFHKTVLDDFRGEHVVLSLNYFPNTGIVHLSRNAGSKLGFFRYEGTVKNLYLLDTISQALAA